MKESFKIFVVAMLFGLFSLSSFGAGFDGCRGTSIMKSNGAKTADVANELKNSDARIKKLCEEELPPRLKKMQDLAASCQTGISPSTRPELIQKFKEDVFGLIHSAIYACKAMKESMKNAESYCAERGKIAGLPEAEIKDNTFLPKNGPGSVEAVSSQIASFEKMDGIYSNAESTYKQLSANAKKASQKIYNHLPAENKAIQRSGIEGATTPDPERDRLVKNLEQSTSYISKENKNQQACQALIGADGEAGALVKKLKENLWPNGKRAARSLNALAGTDERKAQEYAAKKAKVNAQKKSMGGETQSADDRAAVAEEQARQEEIRKQNEARNFVNTEAPIETNAVASEKTEGELAPPDFLTDNQNRGGETTAGASAAESIFDDSYYSNPDDTYLAREMGRTAISPISPTENFEAASESISGSGPAPQSATSNTNISQTCTKWVWGWSGIIPTLSRKTGTLNSGGECIVQ